MGSFNIKATGSGSSKLADVVSGLDIDLPAVTGLGIFGNASAAGRILRCSGAVALAGKCAVAGQEEE